MACDQFVEACPIYWKHERGSGWNQELEGKYNARVEVCPTEAIHWIGTQRTAGEVITEVLRDRPFYEDGGGMTLTGGEPTMQPDMAEALLCLAKTEGISTAMETCGHTQFEVLEQLLPYLDHILFDLKHVDSEIHRKFTGVNNRRILSNLRRLIKLQAPVIIRVPLIPGFNANTESLQAIAELLLSWDDSIQTLDLLPYHTLGKSKYPAIGFEYPWEDYTRLTDEEVNMLVNTIEAYGLTVRIGG